jgi:hypothetical protein
MGGGQVWKQRAQAETEEAAAKKLTKAAKKQ